MNYEVSSIKEYMDAIPKERRDQISKLRQAIKRHLPKGFEEVLQYNMISYVVPLSLYPEGYHVKKETPLAFLSVGNQKHTINLYHSAIYADEELRAWFVKEYQQIFDKKPNMGKSCIRFKTINQEVISLVERLARKVTVREYIELYGVSIV